MTTHKLTDPVQLSFTRVRNGAHITGLAVAVVVRNEETGAVLLSSTALSEVTPGLYTYKWAHGRVVQTSCIATYTVDGVDYKEFFILDDLINRIDDSDGRAS